MTDAQAASLKAAARCNDTTGEAEARRAGYAAGYDEASKRSGARIAELEAERSAAYARGAAAMRERAAALCEQTAEHGWPAYKEGRCNMARGIRALAVEERDDG